jgi:integrase
VTVFSVLDAAGRRRSPATMPGYHAGRPPRNKGIRYPADPPTVDEIVAVMRHTADNRHGWRLRAIIVVLWRAGLRVQEAIALAEHDLDPRRGSILVRRGKGGMCCEHDHQIRLSSRPPRRHPSARRAILRRLVTCERRTFRPTAQLVGWRSSDTHDEETSTD